MIEKWQQPHDHLKSTLMILSQKLITDTFLWVEANYFIMALNVFEEADFRIWYEINMLWDPQMQFL